MAVVTSDSPALAFCLLPTTLSLKDPVQGKWDGAWTVEKTLVRRLWHNLRVWQEAGANQRQR